MSLLIAGEPPSGNALMPVRLPSRTSILLMPYAGSSDAATAMTRLPAAGEPSVLSPGPELPAAATTEQPSSVALSEATAVASSGPPPPPKLMLITSATGLGWKSTVEGDTASSIAITMFEVKQPPITPLADPTVDIESLHTLEDINFACGAPPAIGMALAVPRIPS